MLVEMEKLCFEFGMSGRIAAATAGICDKKSHPSGWLFPYF
jgi:hypothetical protein